MTHTADNTDRQEGAMGVKDWNPCATCDCRAWCFARCCYRHNDLDANCRPGALCCPVCPEQFHPEHPVGVDCNQSSSVGGTTTSSEERA